MVLPPALSVMMAQYIHGLSHVSSHVFNNLKLTIMFFLVSCLPSSERNGVWPYRHSKNITPMLH